MKKQSKKKVGDARPLATQAPKSHSLVRCTPGDRKRFDAVGKQHALTDQQRIFAIVLDEQALFQQLQDLLQPLMPELGTTGPIQTLQALLAVRSQQHEASHDFEERWGVSLSDVDALFDKAQADGHDKPLSFFEQTLATRDKFRAGAQKRAQHYSATDFSQLPFSQLEQIRAPEAAQERVRRIVQTIMRHNLRAQPRDRWFINAATVNNLKTTRHSIIDAYLKEHQAEIDQHHQQLSIEPRYNRKIEPITEMVSIPDEPLGEL